MILNKGGIKDIISVILREVLEKNEKNPLFGILFEHWNLKIVLDYLTLTIKN